MIKKMLYKLYKCDFRPISAPQSKLAKEIGRDGPFSHYDADAITELPNDRPSTSHSRGKIDSGKSSLGKVFDPKATNCLLVIK